MFLKVHSLTQWLNDVKRVFVLFFVVFPTKKDEKNKKFIRFFCELLDS